MSASPNLKLPYIDANQNQKSVTHNEALRILDALVNLHVASNGLAAPPASPNDGQCWIVASGASGAWLGKDLNIAAWQDGAWTFYPPNPGFVAYVDTIGGALMWNGTAWVSLIGAITQLSLNSLGIGTAADPSNRLAVKSETALFTWDDVTPGPGNMRQTLNKKAAAKDAGFIFQDNYSTRALVGLLGDDDFHIKVTPDGTIYHDGLTVAASSGTVGFAQSPTAPTPSAGDASSKLATTGFVAASFLSYAYAGATYATANDATLTGTPTAPTPAIGDTSTKLATTAFVATAAAAALHASLKLAAVDLGNQARHSGRFTLTDAAITAASLLVVRLGPGPYAGKGTLADEAEMYPGISFTAVPGAGQATVYWSTPRGAAARSALNVFYSLV